MAHKKPPALMVAAAFAAIPGMAFAAEPPCLTTPEFAGLATYALPGVIGDVSHRCAATLPAGAFLTVNGEALAQRYGAAGPAVWPAAKAAFLKLSAGAGPDAAALVAAMPDDSLQQFVAMAAGQVASKKLATDHCTAIDAAVQSLAPLPAENIGQLLAVLVSLSPRTAEAGPARLGKLSICPAATDSAPLPAAPSGRSPSQIPPAPAAGKP